MTSERKLHGRHCGIADATQCLKKQNKKTSTTNHGNGPAVSLRRTESSSPAWEEKLLHFSSPTAAQVESISKNSHLAASSSHPHLCSIFPRLKKGKKKERKKAEALTVGALQSLFNGASDSHSEGR